MQSNHFERVKEPSSCFNFWILCSCDIKAHAACSGLIVKPVLKLSWSHRNRNSILHHVLMWLRSQINHPFSTGVPFCFFRVRGAVAKILKIYPTKAGRWIKPILFYKESQVVTRFTTPALQSMTLCWAAWCHWLLGSSQSVFGLSFPAFLPIMMPCCMRDRN